MTENLTSLRSSKESETIISYLHPMSRQERSQKISMSSKTAGFL